MYLPSDHGLLPRSIDVLAHPPRAAQGGAHIPARRSQSKRQETSRAGLFLDPVRRIVRSFTPAYTVDKIARQSRFVCNQPGIDN